MKKRIFSLLLLPIMFGFMVASSCNNNGSPSSIEFTIFHTNDIHSHLRSAKADPFGLGGLARLGTLLKQLRPSRQASITLDAGDYSEGTMYFNVDTGANMLKMMGMMGYDAACLGNHDFLIGPDQIIRTMKDAGTPFPVMAANLEMSNYPRAAELKAVLPPTLIKTINGLKVGIIGLTTFDIIYASYLQPVQITNAIDVATQYAKLLRPQVDILLIVSHNDLELNKLLAAAVPGVDAVISGHSHRKLPKAILVQNAGRDVPVVETGQWGTFLGDLRLTVSAGRRGAVVAFKSYELRPVSPDIAEDPQIVQFIDSQDRVLSDKYHGEVTRIVSESDFTLIQQDGTETALGNLAVKAYRASTGADLALEEISLTGVSVPKGPASFMDLHDVIPHVYDPATGKEWELRVWNAKGSDLSLIFNVFYTVDGLVPLGSPLGWLSADNAVVTWEPGLKRVRAAAVTPSTFAIPSVKSLVIGGKLLDPNARYRVAIADGLLLALRLANEKFHLNVDLADIQDSGIEAWQSVVNYSTQAHRLTMQDLGVGGHSFTLSPDLAVFYYSMDWDGMELTVEVQNLGLTQSAVGSLICSTGLPNNFVAFNTEIQSWKQLPMKTVPSLAPNGSVSLQIPWSSQGLTQGYWPVNCEVRSAGDKYSPNNSAQKVFRVSAR